MKYVSATDITEFSVCVNSELYILMGAYGDAESCPIVDRVIQCTPKNFPTLPGNSAITGTKSFGGITAATIVMR
jgi:hypothetical protein